MDGACSTHGTSRPAYSTLVEDPEGKRSLGRSISKWGHNIKTDLKETGCSG
jgi:hypothetical protein